MKKNYLWTTSKSRLQMIKTEAGKNYHWLFLPGGPGLGSESLTELSQMLSLPGTIWHLDLPGDGSNTSDSACFSQWSRGLVEAVNALDNVILVAHSTGGMYALATPELEHALTGLVLIDSAPDASWQIKFNDYIKQHPLAEIETLQNKYIKQPSNETLKKLTVASVPYLFTTTGLKKGIALLESLTSFNFKSCDWSAQHFDSSYKAKWIPKNTPTLIIAGDDDQITPVYLFTEKKEFQSEKIIIRPIKNAGHYPWIDNPAGVIAAFEEYCQAFL